MSTEPIVWLALVIAFVGLLLGYPADKRDRGRASEITRALLACDDLLTEHVEGPRDLAEHARRLRNLQVHVSDLVRRLGLRGDR